MHEEAIQARQVITRRIFVAQLGLVVLACLMGLVSYLWPSVLGSLFFCLFLGALGGSVALVKRVRGAGPTLLTELSSDVVSTLMPLLYGCLMASVGYLLFMSGILSGEGGSGLFTSNLFPNFTAPASLEGELLSARDFIKMRPASIQDLGKLLVWCFIAGHSESFVSGILHQLERSGEERTAGAAPKADIDRSADDA